MLVTERIRDRLAAVLTGTQTVRVGPLSDGGADNAALALCLYRIAVSSELRNGGHRRPATASEPERFFEDAIPFDLHYLVTAAQASGGDDLEGLSRLGAAMLALFVRPTMEDASLGWEPVRLSLDRPEMDELGRIWSLFPTVNYRTSFAFVATPVWLDPPQPRPGVDPIVRQDTIWPTLSITRDDQDG